MELLQEQVKDARNIVNKNAKGASLYPEQFNLHGTTLEQSKDSMKEREMKIAGWIRYYLGLPGHSHAQS